MIMLTKTHKYIPLQSMHITYNLYKQIIRTKIEMPRSNPFQLLINHDTYI
jgi:hypothetical protein